MHNDIKITATEQNGGQINQLQAENNTIKTENQENNDNNTLKEIGARSYTTLKSEFNKYLYLPDGADTALALWTIFTYGYKDFEFAPRLAILSPEPRCGKSTVLRVLECLVNEPANTSNISTAAIYIKHICLVKF